VGAFLSADALRLDASCPYRRLVGIGGIGVGVFFALEGDHDLGRNESRPARLLDVRDYCKLHIIAHYPAVLLGARPEGEPFHVLPVGKVGDDDAGRHLKEEMAAVGMDLRFVASVRDHPTLQSVCFQYPDGAGGNITTSDSAAAALTAADIDAAEPFIDEHTMVLAAPEVPLDARHHLLRLARSRGALAAAALTSVETGAALARRLFDDVDLLALNEDEARALTGVPFDPAAPGPLLDACVEILTKDHPGIRIVVTAGATGAFAFEAGHWLLVPALDVPVASTAGAGDALLGGVLAALAAGLPLVPGGPAGRSRGQGSIGSALELGVLLAAYKVTSPHTIHPDARLSSLLAFARGQGIRVVSEGARS